MIKPSTGEPRLAAWASWAVLAASFGLSASTWIALARLAGFTATLTLPLVGVTLSMAWLMPIAVDGYVVVALVLWMAPVPARVALFAKRNTYGAAGIGIAAQSAYHLLFTMSTTDQGWRVVLAAIVGALPPAVAGLAVHMRALIRRESGKPAAPSTVDGAVLSADPQPTTPAALNPTPAPTPAPAVTPEPAPVPADPTIPSPVQVAARITPRPSILRPVSAGRPGPAARPVPARTSTPATPPATLAPPATDTPVTEPGAAQLALPIVTPALLNRARDVARQYRTEHGTPITAGRLAVRLQVSSEHAAQLLAAMQSTSGRTVATVNGRRTEATR